MLTVNVDTISNAVHYNYGGIVNVMSGVSYIMGLVLVIQATLKFKEFKADNENSQQRKWSQALAYLIVCFGFLALPSFIPTKEKESNLLAMAVGTPPKLTQRPGPWKGFGTSRVSRVMKVV